VVTKRGKKSTPFFVVVVKVVYGLCRKLEEYGKM
jgi:hypothetical protein